METQVSQVVHSVNRHGDVPCAGANAESQRMDCGGIRTTRAPRILFDVKSRVLRLDKSQSADSSPAHTE